MKQATLFFSLVTILTMAIQPCIAQVLGGGGNQGAGNQGIGNRNAGLGETPNGGGGNAAGGGSFADFDSLMELIQTTVAPETWESLGGPSNMFPYPQGVFVDASGTLRQCESLAGDDAVRNLKSQLARPGEIDSQNEDWLQPSPMRCVSLRRLIDHRQHFGTEAPESMDCLAGLSQIQYLFFQGDDIIIAGPVGGIESFQGWNRDRQSGRTTLRFDFLATCFAAALAKTPFGCTIDPTTEGLQRAAQVSMRVKNQTIPIGMAPAELMSALGMQRIEVFGTAADTPIGYVMVEADRHMKQLALGIHSMPRNANNYLEVLEQSIQQGPPQDTLLRLWFTSKPRSVRGSPDRTVFEIAGTPIQLSGQNERAVAVGERGRVTLDPRTSVFVDQFNQHWNDIRWTYPIYGALESIYQSASVAELARRGASSFEHQQLLKLLAKIDTSGAYWMPTPRQVESITVLHSFQRGQKQHHLLVASGGVAVDTEQMLTSSVAEYPSLGSLAAPTRTQPRVVQRWWWDH